MPVALVDALRNILEKKVRPVYRPEETTLTLVDQSEDDYPPGIKIIVFGDHDVLLGMRGADGASYDVRLTTYREDDTGEKLHRLIFPFLKELSIPATPSAPALLKKTETKPPVRVVTPPTVQPIKAAPLPPKPVVVREVKAPVAPKAAVAPARKLERPAKKAPEPKKKVPGKGFYQNHEALLRFLDELWEEFPDGKMRRFLLLDFMAQRIESNDAGLKQILRWLEENAFCNRAKDDTFQFLVRDTRPIGLLEELLLQDDQTRLRIKGLESKLLPPEDRKKLEEELKRAQSHLQ
ncbi:MAG TPA: hypothetical protein VHB93_02300 [Candidatus Paceibacterota bacterium]|nr:hypothetical protein [Candidatus Paceibacterota bacterium]